MINLVTIGKSTYSVDIGFGDNGPMHPLQLPSSGTKQTHNPNDEILGPSSVNVPGTWSRLVWSDPLLYSPQEKHLRDGVKTQLDTDIPSSAQAQTFSWIYQVHFGKPSDNDDKQNTWKSMYAFTTQEFLPRDYKVLNHYTSTSRQTWFTYQIACVRVLSAAELDDEQSATVSALNGAAVSSAWKEKWREQRDAKDDVTGALAGQVILSERKFKIRVCGETYVINEELKSEEERVEVLARFFGIRLSQVERRGILGTVTAIPA